MPMRKIYAITVAAALYTRTLSFDPDPGAISAYTRCSLAGHYAELLLL